jgi:flagellar protein FliT
MEYPNTIVIYETVAKLTNQMLLAAKQQDWDKLAELEVCCAEHVENLKMVEDALPLATEARERKAASIKSILADDREIRNLVSPWMVRLNTLINSYHTESKLTRAYIQ